MKPLLLTISGYLLIIVFIIFTIIFPVSLDSGAWYDWLSRMMLVLALILNIAGFLWSVICLMKKRKLAVNILACLLSLVFIIVSCSIISVISITVAN